MCQVLKDGECSFVVASNVVEVDLVSNIEMLGRYMFVRLLSFITLLLHDFSSIYSTIIIIIIEMINSSNSSSVDWSF